MENGKIGEHQFLLPWECERRESLSRGFAGRDHLLSKTFSWARVAMLIRHQVSFKGKNLSEGFKLSQKGYAKGSIKGMSLFKYLEERWQNHISWEKFPGIYYLLSPQDKLWDPWWIFCNQMREYELSSTIRPSCHCMWHCSNTKTLEIFTLLCHPLEKRLRKTK